MMTTTLKLIATLTRKHVIVYAFLLVVHHTGAAWVDHREHDGHTRVVDSIAA